MNQKDSISIEFLCPTYMHLNIASLYGRISTHVTWTRKIQFHGHTWANWIYCPNYMRLNIASLFLEGCYTRHMNQKDSILTEFLCPVYMYLNIASLFGRISTHVTWTRKPIEFFCPNLMHWHITSLWNDITHITWTRKITFCIIL